jgi:hypothetical protein
MAPDESIDSVHGCMVHAGFPWLMVINLRHQWHATLQKYIKQLACRLAKEHWLMGSKSAQKSRYPAIKIRLPLCWHHLIELLLKMFDLGKFCRIFSGGFDSAAPHVNLRQVCWDQCASGRVRRTAVIRVAIALFMVAASVNGRSEIHNATPIRRAHPVFVGRGFNYKVPTMAAIDAPGL